MPYIVLDRNKKPTGRAIESNELVAFVKSYLPADKLNSPIDPSRLGKITGLQLAVKLQKKLAETSSTDANSLKQLNAGLYTWFGILLVRVDQNHRQNRPKPRPMSRPASPRSKYSRYGKPKYKPKAKKPHKKVKKSKPAVKWPVDVERNLKMVRGNIQLVRKDGVFLPVGIVDFLDVDTTAEDSYDLDLTAFMEYTNFQPPEGLELGYTSGEKALTPSAVSNMANRYIRVPRKPADKLKTAEDIRRVFSTAFLNRVYRHRLSILEYGVGMISSPNDDPVEWADEDLPKMQEYRRKIGYRPMEIRHFSDLDIELKTLEAWSNVPEIYDLIHGEFPMAYRYFDLVKDQLYTWVAYQTALEDRAFEMDVPIPDADNETDDSIVEIYKSLQENPVSDTFDLPDEPVKYNEAGEKIVELSKAYSILHDVVVFLSSHNKIIKTIFRPGCYTLDRLLGKTSDKRMLTLPVQTMDENVFSVRVKTKMHDLQIAANKKINYSKRGKYSSIPGFKDEFHLFRMNYMKLHANRFDNGKKSYSQIDAEKKAAKAAEAAEDDENGDED